MKFHISPKLVEDLRPDMRIFFRILIRMISVSTSFLKHIQTIPGTIMHLVGSVTEHVEQRERIKT